MRAKSEKKWFEQIPKIELHLHLEGAIPYETLWDLVQKYKGKVPDLEALKQRFQYRSFPHFIETWAWKNTFLREYEDFTLISEAVAQDLLKQNIFYAEVFFSPADFERFGLETQKLIAAVAMGLSRVPKIEIALVIDLVRDYGPEKGMVTLDKITELKEMGVIGIGIGGSEQSYPLGPFEKIYEKARCRGFFTNAHAGEAAGAESIWDAIKVLQVDRIGHGTRAFEDPKLLDYLVEKQIPLEVCPLSNVRTGVISDIAAHPIRTYFEKGIFVTINSDDPKMFNNSLAEEFQLLEAVYHFSRQEICQLIMGSIDASWLPASRKKQIKDKFQSSSLWIS